ncbi:hypothetical protein COO60DRAFT_1489558, partial [Scenedesmus sp. NREL 46B-D3]
RRMTADSSFLAPVLVVHGCCCAARAVLCSGYALTCPVGGSWSTSAACIKAVSCGTDPVSMVWSDPGMLLLRWGPSVWV